MEKIEMVQLTTTSSISS